MKLSLKVLKSHLIFSLHNHWHIMSSTLDNIYMRINEKLYVKRYFTKVIFIKNQDGTYTIYVFLCHMI